MLINLWLSPVNNELKFDLPPIIFKQGQTVCVSNLFIEWNSPIRFSFMMQSTLVDKSSVNPNQQILFVYQKQNSKFSNYTPTHKEYYKIQCLDLRSSEFKLVELNNPKSIKIKRIFLQLEIDERIQSVTFQA